jgi:hypothetical protein
VRAAAAVGAIADALRVDSPSPPRCVPRRFGGLGNSSSPTLAGDDDITPPTAYHCHCQALCEGEPPSL